MRQRKKKVRVTSEPIAKVTKQGNRMPRTVTIGKGTVVSHTETYGINVTGSNLFSVFATWAIQPGLSAYSKGAPLGSWLPQIAQNFDNYEIESLKFKFRTACSTLTTGLAVFGYEPNPEGTAPTTYQEIRNMFSVDGSVHSNLTFDVSGKTKKKLLIRKGNVFNLPSYDAGKVYFATIGVTGEALIGFVDVEYKIRLTNPQASATTSALPVVVAMPNPVQDWSLDFSSVGDVNAVTEGDYFTNGHLATSASTGAALFAKATGNYPAFDNTYSGGLKFKWPSRTGYSTFNCLVEGRYHFRFAPKIGYEDLKMFAMNVFKVTVGGTTLATRKVFTDINGQGELQLANQFYTHRGFTGTAVGDPNPGTEVWPMIDYYVDCSVGDRLLFAIGICNYNSVSTTTANYRGYSGIGISSLVATYLGPLV